MAVGSVPMHSATPKRKLKAHAVERAAKTRSDGSSLVMSPGARRDPFLFWSMLTLATLVRLPQINDSLWFDEVWRTHVSFAGDSLRFVLFHSTHPPLFALILWGWSTVFGDSEISVRVPSLLCGVGSVAVTYALAKRWFGPRVALLAALVLALSPAHIWYSHENKNNMLLVLLTVTAVWALDRAWHGGSRRAWWVFWTATALSLWTNVFAVWIAFASCLWLWFQVWRSPGRRQGLRWAVTSTAVALVAFVPLLAWDLSQFESLKLNNYLRPFTLPEVYRLLLIYLSHGNTIRTVSPYARLQTILLQSAWLFLVDAFFAALLLAGIAHVATRRSPAQTGAVRATVPDLLLFYFLVPLASVWVACCVYPGLYIERSMLIIVPAYAILLAAGACGARRRALRYGAIAALLVLNAFALFNLWVAKADIWTVYKPKNDWRAAARYLASEMRDGAPPLLLFATAPASVLVYYDNRFREVFEPDATVPAEVRASIEYVASKGKAGIIDRLRQRHAETCYLIEDTFWGNGFKNVRAAINTDPTFQEVAERSFRGINIYTLRWRDDLPP